MSVLLACSALVGYSKFVANTVAVNNACGMQENEEPCTSVLNASQEGADIWEGSM